VELYTAPPAGSTVICADELGPVIPRTFPPAPGWSPDGHRIKAPLEYSRGPEKTWVYGGLRVADGHAVTLCASSRNSAFYQDFLRLEEQANPEGTLYVITDNLSSHDSKSTRAWLEDHPRIRHAFIPKGACWLNFQEGWWRISGGRRWPGRTSPIPTRSPTPPGWPPPSSTPAPGAGSGDDPSLNTAPTAAALYTPFKEPSTSGGLLTLKRVRGMPGVVAWGCSEVRDDWTSALSPRRRGRWRGLRPGSMTCSPGWCSGGGSGSTWPGCWRRGAGTRR
jgi:hypothetical protein